MLEVFDHPKPNLKCTQPLFSVNVIRQHSYKQAQLKWLQSGPASSARDWKSVLPKRMHIMMHY